MYVGEKVSLFRIKLGHKNFQDFGESANVPGGWLLDLCKKQKINNVNMDYLLNLCNYLGITVNQLLEDTDIEETWNLENLDNLDNTDLSYIIKSMIDIIDNNEKVIMDGQLLNDKAKQVCKDALLVTKQLTRQYL